MNHSAVGLEEAVEEISHKVEQNDGNKKIEKMRVYKTWSLGIPKPE